MSDQTSTQAPDPEGPGGPAHGVRRRREQLLLRMNALEAALARPARNAFERWRVAVEAAVAQLSDALAEHTRQTEADDGLLAQIVYDAPHLSSRVSRLREEHSRLAERCGELRDRVAAAEADDLDGLREAGLSLFATLARHRQTGSDLLYDAFMIDVGGDG